MSPLFSQVFKGLGNLKQLDLSFNNLRSLEAAVFAELWSLQELDLYSNNLEVSGVYLVRWWRVAHQ